MVSRTTSFCLWHLQVSFEVLCLPYWKWVNILTLCLPSPHPSWFQTCHETPSFESSNLLSHERQAIGHFIQTAERRKEGQKAKTQKKSTFECARAGGRREQAIQQCTILLFLPQEHTDDSQKWDANSLLPNLDHLAQTHKIKNQTSNVWKNRLKGISTNQRSQMWSPVPGRWNHTTEQTGHSLDSRQLGKKGLSLGRQ